MGDMQVEIRYTEYKDVGNGAKFPMHIHMHQGDHPFLGGRNLMDLIRRRVLETRTLASQEDPEAAVEPSPEETVEAHDLVGRAKAAMTSLTPGQRAALELAYFQGKTSAEVAELEGIPIGTAKTRIRTALAKIREVLVVEHEL